MIYPGKKFLFNEHKMGFYDLTKGERKELVLTIKTEILSGFEKNELYKLQRYFSDSDTYIRKAAYQALGKIFFEEENLQPVILRVLNDLLKNDDYLIRQAAVNAAGEIGMKLFECVEGIFDRSLFDPHSAVRNAVIGSIKKMSEKNPVPVLQWAKKYLHHEDKEIRREICHGIELRGRTHPLDILPMLRELEYDTTARVRNTLVHVLGQIAYKKGCLEQVVEDLKTWKNKEIVRKALSEIIDVHERYKDFAALKQEQAIDYINKEMKAQF